MDQWIVDCCVMACRRLPIADWRVIVKQTVSTLLGIKHRHCILLPVLDWQRLCMENQHKQYMRRRTRVAVLVVVVVVAAAASMFNIVRSCYCVKLSSDITTRLTINSMLSWLCLTTNGGHMKCTRLATAARRHGIDMVVDDPSCFNLMVMPC